MMIQNLYAIVSGRYTGQGLIIVNGHPDQLNRYSAIMWPSARVIEVTEGQLKNEDLCQLLDCLPDVVFQPYKTAHDKIIENPKQQNQDEQQSIDGRNI